MKRGTGMEVECCTSGITYLQHFTKETVMPVCGACAQIKWTDRKMHY